MNLIEIDVAIPAEIDEMVAALSKIAPSSQVVVAGGCLVDLHLGHPFRDVDVFMDAHQFDIDTFNRHTGLDFQVKDGPSRYLDSPFVYAGTYKGIEFDIVGCHKHLNRIMDFDIRFRQFYYVDGKVFASQEALDDILSKRLHIVALSSYTSLTTFARVHDFTSRYGFSLDEESRELLLWYIHGQNRLLTTSLEVISENEKISSRTQQDIMEEFTMCSEEGRLVYPDASFPYHPSLEEPVRHFFNQMQCTTISVGQFSLVHSLLPSYQPMVLPSSFSFQTNGNVIKREQERHFLFLKEKAEKHREKNRLRILLKDPVDAPSTFITWLESDTPQMSEDVRSEARKLFWRDLHSIFGMHPNLAPFRSHLEDHSTLEVVFSHDEEGDCEESADLIGTLLHHVFYIRVWHDGVEQIGIKMRKCADGRFTPSSFFNYKKEERELFWFYFVCVKHALCERYPEWFTFEDADVRGLKHPLTTGEEYFFDFPEYQTIPLFKADDVPSILQPIRYLKRETIDG